ncbi:MAG: vitamin B12 dependent-methionine synthase activation domain-containing protein [Candidatus Bathyarchaeia archaeon]
MSFRRGKGSPVKVIDSVPVKLDAEEFLNTKEVERLRGRLENMEIAALIERCSRLIEPKAVYRPVEVMNIENDEVRLKTGDTLESIVLADTLECGQTIVPRVVTIGPRLEKEASKEGRNSVLQGWILERMGDYALGKAAAHVRSLAEKSLGRAVSSFSPGSGTGRLFSIEQQDTLFQILDPQRNIGVHLTESYLMVPRKSSSGVFAATRHEYVACQYCPRKCEFRGKPFGGEYVSIRCEYEN